MVFCVWSTNRTVPSFRLVGILLCKHHHLLYHNEGWEISRDDNGDYRLSPPINVDPNQTPIRLQQSRNMRDLAREQLTRATA